jgi:hypothetical protein
MTSDPKRLGVMKLDMALMSVKLTLQTLKDSPVELAETLAWVGAELERLAAEAYALSDAADQPTEHPQP